MVATWDFPLSAGNRRARAVHCARAPAASSGREWTTCNQGGSEDAAAHPVLSGERAMDTDTAWTTAVFPAQKTSSLSGKLSAINAWTFFRSFSISLRLVSMARRCRLAICAVIWM